jgi:hypothetical protein
MWALWQQFRNPIFPYANQWFASPWWYEAEAVGRVYGPHTFGQWLEFPFRLTAPRTGYVVEVAYRDPRIATLYALAILAGASWLWRRAVARVGDAPAEVRPVSASAEVWRLVGVFWVASFLLWTAIHSVYRYLVPLDLLTGALIIGLLRYLLRPTVAAPVTALLCAALIAVTKPPDWGRIDFSSRWFKVQAPVLPSRALVLLTTGAPMAYVLPFLPPDARHLGLNNNLGLPGSGTRLERGMLQTIADHEGPIYSLAYPAGEGAGVLEAHGLVRLADSCAKVWTNLPLRPLELCRVVRLPSPALGQSSVDGAGPGNAR